VEVLWKLTGRRFEWEASFLISAPMKGSRGCVKLIDAMGKVVRMTVDVGNSCGDDGPVLGAPFIPTWWCEAVHCGMQSPAAFVLHCGFNRCDSRI
jgi:hypothetical protein